MDEMGGTPSQAGFLQSKIGNLKSKMVSVGWVESVKPNTKGRCIGFPLVLQPNLQIVFNFANLIS